MKQSGFLKKQAADREDYSIALQYTIKQFMIDTAAIALNEDEKDPWGYDRIMRFMERWEKVRAQYFPAIDPRDQMCDVEQEHMERFFARVCEGKGEVIPFDARYPYLKKVRYDKPYKEARR